MGVGEELLPSPPTLSMLFLVKESVDEDAWVFDEAVWAGEAFFLLLVVVLEVLGGGEGLWTGVGAIGSTLGKMTSFFL